MSLDKPLAGLILDLRRRGLLEDTLLVCAGEFGRTPFDQDLSRGKEPPKTYGRGHSPQGFSIFMAGGGVRKGYVHGDTDDLGYRVVEGKVHVHDLHATILHLIGLDHERLTYRHGARDVSLTDVHGQVVEQILA
jgi:arylsulfatase A-like enzyme